MESVGDIGCRAGRVPGAGDVPEQAQVSDAERIHALEFQVRQLAAAITMLGEAHVSLLRMLTLQLAQPKAGELTQ